MPCIAERWFLLAEVNTVINTSNNWNNINLEFSNRERQLKCRLLTETRKAQNKNYHNDEHDWNSVYIMIFRSVINGKAGKAAALLKFLDTLTLSQLGGEER